MTNLIYYALVALTIYIPFEEFIEKWIPIGIFYDIARYGGEILLFGLLLFTLGRNILSNARLFKTPIDIPFIAFILASVISASINGVPTQVALLGLRPILRYAILFYILCQVRFPSHYYQRLLRVMIVSAILVSFIGIFQTIIGWPLTNVLIPGDVTVGDTVVRAGLRHVVAPRTYIFSTMGRYDTLGTFVTIFILLSVSIYLYATGRQKRSALFFLLIGFPVLALTFSRQAWLATAIGIFIIIFAGRGKKHSILRLLSISFGLVLILILLLMIPNAHYLGSTASADASITERILEPFSERYLEISRYSYGRLFVIVDVGGRLLGVAPWFGLGPGVFGSIAAQYFGYDYSALLNLPEYALNYINDVNWIILLGQIGMIGTAAFIWIWFSLGNYAFKVYTHTNAPLTKALALFYISVVAAFLFLGFFGPNFEVRQISYYVWGLGGILYGLYCNEKYSKRTQEGMKPVDQGEFALS